MSQPKDAPRKGRDYTWFIVGAIAIVAALVVLFIIQPSNQQVSQSDARATEGAQFMVNNANADGVVTTASGLQYRVVTQGDGPQPTASDTVTVHYTGKLLDGTVFDSSVERGQPISFPLQGVIPGWTEGVQLMNVGSKYEFWIPPELAYGARGAGNGVIPPNATLYFEVELLGIEGQ
ncbi:MAG: FKBP-type peptidyl-prolyl cis-trans isomerase [Anaerolineae bacterium]